MPPEPLEPAPELLPLGPELLPELAELLPERLVETLPGLPDPPESRLELRAEPEPREVEMDPPSLGVPSAIEPLPCVELDEPHAAMAAGANASAHRAEKLVLLSIDWTPVRFHPPAIRDDHERGDVEHRDAFLSVAGALAVREHYVGDI